MSPNKVIVVVGVVPVLGASIARRFGVMVKCCVLRFSGGDFINLDSVLEFHSFDYVGQPV